MQRSYHQFMSELISLGWWGEAPPERGTFLRLQLYERVGISLVEVYEGLGPIRANKCILWLWKSRDNVIVFLCTHIKRLHLQQF